MAEIQAANVVDRSSATGLRLGLSSGAFYPVPTEDVPAIAARLGLRDVELMLQSRGEYEPAFIHQVAENCRMAGVNVHAIHTWLQLHPVLDTYRRRVDEGRALFDQAIAAAVELGARAIVWHGPRRHDMEKPDAWERFIAVCGELATACGRAGVTLAVENVSWCALATVRDVMAFAARLPELGPPAAIGFTFDPFQAAEAGANPFMILAAMEGRLANVHLSDHREGDPAARHLPPGDGDLPWPAILRAVAAAGYTGPLMIEGQIKDDPTALDRIRARFDPLLRTLSAAGDAPPDCDGDLPPGVLEGIHLFNERKFYECHEEIEHEWHAERGPIRRLYQGILQIGVGFHHARAGNHRGAVLLLTDGIEKTSGFLPRCRGVDTARLVTESQACLDRIIALGPDGLDGFDWDAVPFVHLESDRRPS